MIHRYVWTKEDIDLVFKRDVYLDLIYSDALARLRDIRFLGAIDYLVHPNGRELTRRRHTRLEHTLGVAQFALLYSNLTHLCESDEMLLVTAALLHDVGHSPLSHSLEGVFREQFGIDHHQAGRDLILGQAPVQVGKTIAACLRAANIDPEAVLELIDGQSQTSEIAALFAHPINIDTIEAICRSETYIKGRQTSLSPDLILRSLQDPSRLDGRLDDFWRLKGQIYELLIQGPIGILADYAASNYVRQHSVRFVKEDFFKSEREFRRVHPGIFSELEGVRARLSEDSITNPTSGRTHLQYQARKFHIDTSQPHGSSKRYRQAKVLAQIAIPNLTQRASDNESFETVQMNFGR
jgi:hypothetical protein